MPSQLNFLNDSPSTQNVSKDIITSCHPVTTPRPQNISHDSPLVDSNDHTITMPSNTHPTAMLWAHRLQSENRKIFDIVHEKHSAMDSKFESVKASTDAKIYDLERRVDKGLDKSNVLLKGQASNKDITSLASDILEQANDLASLQADLLEKTQNLDSFRADAYQNMTKIDNLERAVQRIESLIHTPARSESTTPRDSTLSPTLFLKSQVRVSCAQDNHHPNDRLLSYVEGQVSLNSQGKGSLEDYLLYAEQELEKQLNPLVANFRQTFFETFLKGLDSKSHRTGLHEKLDQIGWTWGNIEAEVGKLKGARQPRPRARVSKRKA